MRHSLKPAIQSMAGLKIEISFIKFCVQCKNQLMPMVGLIPVPAHFVLWSLVSWQPYYKAILSLLYPWSWVVHNPCANHNLQITGQILAYL